jgi:hypothetical protein
LVHEVLDAFFKRQFERGRPAVNEPWNETDREELLALLDAELERTRQRGRTGLDVFAAHEYRRLRAELATFLERDTAFRFETGARPVAFEEPIPEQDYGGIRLRGFVDRIDATPDGRKAWVLDYKTGSAYSYRTMTPEDPLAGGSKLQLPVYSFAAPNAEAVQAFYWFISSAGGFERRAFAPTPENMNRFDQTLGAILAGVGAGAFPAVPGDEDGRPRGSFVNCAYCDFARLCTTRRADEFESKHDDRAIDAWSAVRRVAQGESR